MASEEQEAIIKIGSGSEKYIVTADPLDGGRRWWKLIWPLARS